MSAFCVSETNKVSSKALSIHLSNTQQAKCQAHSSPNKPTLTQGFSWGENNCLFKCFFITSTSNLATHEVCHEEREIGSQLSPPVDSSPKKKSLLLLRLLLFFCYALSFPPWLLCFKSHLQSDVFTSEAFSPRLAPTPLFLPLTCLSTVPQVFVLWLSSALARC